MQDPALDPRFALDGIQVFFQRGDSESENESETHTMAHTTARQTSRPSPTQIQSHIIRIEGCGHWTPLEPLGQHALEALLGWAVAEGSEDSARSGSAAGHRKREVGGVEDRIRRGVGGGVVVETYY